MDPEVGTLESQGLILVERNQTDILMMMIVIRKGVGFPRQKQEWLENQQRAL